MMGGWGNDLTFTKISRGFNNRKLHSPFHSQHLLYFPSPAFHPQCSSSSRTIFLCQYGAARAWFNLDVRV